VIAAEEAEFGEFTPKIDLDALLARALAEEARLPHDHTRHVPEARTPGGAGEGEKGVGGGGFVFEPGGVRGNGMGGGQGSGVRGKVPVWGGPRGEL